ncbi:hypothetical protein FACS189427_02530 [Planctomycetales bacterium]|nr:hypothetical protein FACS189427_02530 [Planctomycetales bacterium]
MPSETSLLSSEKDTLQLLIFECLQELRAIRCSLAERNSNRKATVNSSVVQFITKFPDVQWTADSLAVRIGCSASAVKQSRCWKAYRKQVKAAKYDTRRTAVVYDDYDEVDEKLDGKNGQ